jgi:hypothetical protein
MAILIYFNTAAKNRGGCVVKTGVRNAFAGFDPAAA